MTTVIALLRAVNLGPHQNVAMPDLRAMLTALGARDARTLLQSGNAVFRMAATDTAALERRLEDASATRLGVATDCFVRTASAWRAALAANPYAEMAARDPGHLVLFCLKDALTRARLQALRAAIAGRETVAGRGTELYACYPDGIGRSKLTTTVIERRLGTRVTGRNWNTVLKLDRLAADIEAGAQA